MYLNNVTLGQTVTALPVCWKGANSINIFIACLAAKAAEFFEGREDGQLRVAVFGLRLKINFMIM